jgi:hypothetical protein
MPDRSPINLRDCVHPVNTAKAPRWIGTPLYTVRLSEQCPLHLPVFPGSKANSSINFEAGLDRIPLKIHGRKDTHSLSMTRLVPIGRGAQAAADVLPLPAFRAAANSLLSPAASASERILPVLTSIA